MTYGNYTHGLWAATAPSGPDLTFVDAKSKII